MTRTIHKESTPFTKGILLALFCFMFLCGTGFAQDSTQDTTEVKEKGLSGYFDQAVFHLPNGKPYLETYITIMGKTMTLNARNRPKVQVTVLIKKNDSIIDYRKTNNTGPVMKDTSIADIVDVKRFSLDPGIYKVEAHLKDLNKDSAHTYSIHSSTRIPDYADTIAFSGIELVDSYQRTRKKDLYTKSGLRLIPYVADYYPPKVNTLNFYAELYDRRKDKTDTGNIAIRSYIYDRDRNKMLPQYHKVRVQTPKEVNVIFESMDISKLRSGNFDLVLEARNAKNEVITKRSIFFQRNAKTQKEAEEELRSIDIQNTFAARLQDTDSLRTYIKSLEPIANNVETNLIRHQAEVMNKKTMQRFLYNFWVARDEQNPRKAWLEYKERVDIVNERFAGGYKAGYESDRGRIYLKYGKPNQIIERPHKPHSYPYQIWQYYKAGQYSNKKFVFYNPDLANDDYQLLHSDMPGEIRNRRWKRVLQDRSNIMRNVDDEDVRDHYGREVDELYKNP